MTGKTCEACDETLDPDRDKAGGSYHAKCLPCLRAQAHGRDKHYHQCDERECLVCHDYTQERIEDAKPYLLARLSEERTPNANLDEFR